MYSRLQSFIKSKAAVDEEKLELICSYFSLVEKKRNEILVDSLQNHQ